MNILKYFIMKKIIIACFASMLLLGAVSCSDPYADELYELKNTEGTEGPGGDEGGDPPNNPPPGG